MSKPTLGQAVERLRSILDDDAAPSCEVRAAAEAVASQCFGTAEMVRLTTRLLSKLDSGMAETCRHTDAEGDHGVIVEFKRALLALNGQVARFLRREDVTAYRRRLHNLGADTRETFIDKFPGDTEAPSLGLEIKPIHAPGRQYAVLRTCGDETLLEGDRVQVRLFLRGYAAAMGHPVLTALADAIDDEDAGNARILDMACAAAALVPGGGR